MSREFYITRGVTELGPLTEKEVRELLHQGFLLPADLYWEDGMADWEELVKFAARPSGEKGALGLVKLTTETVSSVSRTAANQASDLTRKLKSLAGRGRGQVTRSTTHLLDAFTPQIQKLVAHELVKKSVASVQDAIHDDVFMRKVFGATYDCLPKPVYRFVTEEAFLKFCMERRAILLGQTSSSPPPEN